jgi:hypothetical protein
MGYDVWLNIGSFGSVVMWPSMTTSRKPVAFGMTVLAFKRHLAAAKSRGLRCQ